MNTSFLPCSKRFISMMDTRPRQFLVLALCLSTSMGLLVYVECRERFGHMPQSLFNVKDAYQRLAPLADKDEICIAIFGDTKEGVDIFTRIMEACERDSEIEAIVHTGDLVHGGCSKEFSALGEIIQKTSRKPFLPVPGNHDFHNGSQQEYSTAFGRLHYTFKMGRRVWIFMNLTRSVSDMELSWLRSVMKRNDPSVPKVIIMHVPPIDPRPGMHHCAPSDGAKALGKLLKNENVEHIFAGHIHGFYQVEWEGIPVTITGGGGARLYSEDQEHGFYHYLKVRITPNEIRVTPIAIESKTCLRMLRSFFGHLQGKWVQLILMGSFALSFVAIISLWLRKHPSTFEEGMRQ